MLQAAFSDGLFLDLLSHLQDLSTAPVIDISRRQIAEALVVTVIVVVIDEGADLPFQVAGQVVVFEQNPVLHCLMPALDLALSLRMMRCSSNVVHALGVEVVGQIGGDVGRTIVAEQSRLLDDRRLITP